MELSTFREPGHYRICSSNVSINNYRQPLIRHYWRAHFFTRTPTRCHNNLQDPFVKIRTVFHGWRRGKNVAASLIYARPLRGPWLIKNAVVILWTHSSPPRVIGQRGSNRDRRSSRLDVVAGGQPLPVHVHLIDCFILLVVRSRLLSILSNSRVRPKYERPGTANVKKKLYYE